MLDSGTASYLQRYQDRINSITNPYNQQSTAPTMGPGQPNNAGTGYSLNNNYAVGSRIYNGTMNSPHSGGGLDPTGYVDRDNMAAVKNNMLASKIGGM